ncbi:MAG TPA: acyltransferase family protein, partial [Opitutus sp.]|nr:acyltransferase family protein [Opitutus sp.]
MTSSSTSSRLDYLDATRAFALILGVLFHASLSFLPFFIGWAVQDVSTSPVVGWFFTVSHSFRMQTFFLLAGFFGCVTLRRQGAAGFVGSRAIRIGAPFLTGWFLLRPLLVSGWIIGFASMHGDYHFWSGIAGGFRSLQ